MFKELISPHILKISPYRPGKPISEVKREFGLEDVIKMASNENPLGPSPLAIEAIKRSLCDVHYYPEDSSYYLREKLGEKLGVTPEMLCLGNGSSEIIVNVGRAFLQPGDEVLTSEKSFVMYYLCGAYTNNPVVQAPMKEYRYDLEAMAERVTPKTRVIFIANPNNPTGTYFGRSEWERFLEKIPTSVLVVLDEAYCEYVDSPDYPNGLDYLSRFPNLLILRTFSKIYGLAGIRVGYGIGSPEIVEILNRVKLPFNANALGQEAALAALDDRQFVSSSQEVNRQGLSYLHGELAGHRFSFMTSVTNFIMILLPVDGQVIFEKMQQEGVIIRPLRGFGVPNALRVTVGRPDENRKFFEAFRRAMAAVTAPIS